MPTNKKITNKKRTNKKIYIPIRRNRHTKIKRSTKKSKKNTKRLAGYLESFDTIYNENREGPKWRVGTFPWTTLVKVRDLNLYGSSLPEWDQTSMEDIFRYYLFRKDIKQIISLQGCGDQTSPYDHNFQFCGPGGRGEHRMLENQVFYQTKNASSATRDDPDVKIVDYTIKDMTSGNLNIWLNISTMRFDNQPSLFHCYAGLGRTGSVLLYFILLTKGNTNICTEPYMGTGNSTNMYQTLGTLLRDNIHLESEPDNTTINGRIHSFDPLQLVNEVFHIHTNHGKNMLISRINYIILMLAQNYGLTIHNQIYLYPMIRVHEFEIGFDNTNMFRPVQLYFNNITQEDLYQHFFIERPPRVFIP